LFREEFRIRGEIYDWVQLFQDVLCNALVRCWKILIINIFLYCCIFSKDDDVSDRGYMYRYIEVQMKSQSSWVSICYDMKEILEVALRTWLGECLYSSITILHYLIRLDQSMRDWKESVKKALKKTRRSFVDWTNLQKLLRTIKKSHMK
jgi:hypothetical protein